MDGSWQGVENGKIGFQGEETACRKVLSQKKKLEMLEEPQMGEFAIIYKQWGVWREMRLRGKARARFCRALQALVRIWIVSYVHGKPLPTLSPGA